MDWWISETTYLSYFWTFARLDYIFFGHDSHITEKFYLVQNIILLHNQNLENDSMK